MKGQSYKQNLNKFLKVKSMNVLTKQTNLLKL